MAGSKHATIAQQLAKELRTELEIVECVLRESFLSTQYSFLVKAFKPSYLYWESLDMIRKLMMMGFIMVVRRGSAAQLGLAATVSFLFFALQMKTWPYK